MSLYEDMYGGTDTGKKVFMYIAVSLVMSVLHYTVSIVGDFLFGFEEINAAYWGSQAIDSMGFGFLWAAIWPFIESWLERRKKRKQEGRG